MQACGVAVLVLAGDPVAPPLCSLQVNVSVAFPDVVPSFGLRFGGGSALVVFVEGAMWPPCLIGRISSPTPWPLVMGPGSPQRWFGLSCMLGPLLILVGELCGIGQRCRDTLWGLLLCVVLG
jgi:hypothetical protein